MMKVYILTDLEGATGVAEYDYGDHARRRQDREFLINDVNAAVAGAYDAGAQAVVVYDGHGKGAVLLDKLDSRATLIKGKMAEAYLPGLDGSFTHLVLVGYHSMAGAGGLLSHTYSRRVRQIRLNGQEIGEIGLGFLYASLYGVKPAFISGDDKAVAEARRYVAKIEGVAVKRTISKECGEYLTPQCTYQLIYDGVENALSNDQSPSVDLPHPPYEMEVIYKRPWIALPRHLIKGQFAGFRVKSLYTIRYKDTDFGQLMKRFVT